MSSPTSTPTPAPELVDPPAQDVPGIAATCQRRILEREGIAMFVALHDARHEPRLAVTDPVGLVEGARLAELFDHYERGLAGAAVDPELSEAAIEGDCGLDVDPTGAAALIDVLVVLSDQHLRARWEQSA